MNKYKQTELTPGLTMYERSYNVRRNTFILLGVLLFIALIIGTRYNTKKESGFYQEKTREIVEYIPTPTPTQTPSEPKLRGTASYYSRAGCLGCSKTLTMANGQTLDDSRLTLALTPQIVRQYKLLNDTVRVKNVKNNKVVEAQVTDTGGFSKYNRIADLSVATKEALLCSSLCEVTIEW